jgi:hypothetical protein
VKEDTEVPEKKNGKRKDVDWILELQRQMAEGPFRETRIKAESDAKKFLEDFKKTPTKELLESFGQTIQLEWLPRHYPDLEKRTKTRFTSLGGNLRKFVQSSPSKLQMLADRLNELNDNPRVYYTLINKREPETQTKIYKHIGPITCSLFLYLIDPHRFCICSKQLWTNFCYLLPKLGKPTHDYFEQNDALLKWSKPLNIHYCELDYILSRANR